MSPRPFDLSACLERPIDALPHGTGWRVDGQRVERPWPEPLAKHNGFTTCNKFTSVRTLFFKDMVDRHVRFVRILHFHATSPLSLRKGRRRGRSDAFTPLEGGLCYESHPDDLQELRQ